MIIKVTIITEINVKLETIVIILVNTEHRQHKVYVIEDIPKTVPAVFHNSLKYNFHFIIRDLRETIEG